MTTNSSSDYADHFGMQHNRNVLGIKHAFHVLSVHLGFFSSLYPEPLL